MKILLCYTRFPWPLNKGDALTVFKLLEFLTLRHQVDFLTVDPLDHTYMHLLPSKIRSVILVPNPISAQVLRLMRSIPTGRSLQVEAFFGRPFASARDRLLRQNNYDIVYSHYIRSFGHGDFNPRGARKVIGLQLSHQAHFVRAAENERNPLVRWLYGIETGRLEHWEGRIAGYNDLIHLISPRDLARIKNNHKWRSRVFFNPHGVDPEEFAPAPASRVRGRLIFTGNLGFQANEDAVLWLLREIWPRVFAACPFAELVVAGARPTAAIRSAVSSAPSARLIAHPARMAEVVQTGDVAIDPLRIGAGLQNKILEAMSCALPVVATRLANEGIGAYENREIVLADDAESLAAQVIKLLDDRDYNRKLGRNARTFIELSWSWSHHFRQLEDRWLALVSEAVSVR